MRRRKLADRGSAALGLVLLALGGLVVIKPAVDHWDSLYRDDPFVSEQGSAFERVLGDPGLLALRLALVALAALCAAAVLRRLIGGREGSGGDHVSLHERGLAPAATNEDEPTRRASIVTPAAVINAPTGGDEPTPTSLASPIATLISSRREELGLSQRELAKRAGVSHTVVSRIEQGEHTPSRKTLERLADALETSRT